MSLKNPVTPPGIDPGTVRLVAQRLNHYVTPSPKISEVLNNNLQGSRLREKVWLEIFEPNLSRINSPIFSNLVILLTYPPMKMEQSVPKRRHIKFRRRGITQKKAYNIKNTAKSSKSRINSGL